jgi:hypothetical protein
MKLKTITIKKIIHMRERELDISKVINNTFGRGTASS